MSLWNLGGPNRTEYLGTVSPALRSRLGYFLSICWPFSSWCSLECGWYYLQWQHSPWPPLVIPWAFLAGYKQVYLHWQIIQTQGMLLVALVMGLGGIWDLTPWVSLVVAPWPFFCVLFHESETIWELGEQQGASSCWELMQASVREWSSSTGLSGGTRGADLSCDTAGSGSTVLSCALRHRWSERDSLVHGGAKHHTQCCDNSIGPKSCLSVSCFQAWLAAAV